VTLQNVNAWDALAKAAPAVADAEPDGGSGGAGGGVGGADDDNLWNEFQSREEQQKKRARPAPVTGYVSQARIACTRQQMS